MSYHLCIYEAQVRHFIRPLIIPSLIINSKRYLNIYSLSGTRGQVTTGELSIVDLGKTGIVSEPVLDDYVSITYLITN